MLSLISTREHGGTGWPGGVPFQWLERLAAVPKRYVHGVARFALLRWALGEDDDVGLKVRIATGHQGTSTCSVCHGATRAHLFGLQYRPRCEKCIARKSITCWQLHSFDSLGMRPDDHGFCRVESVPWSVSPVQHEEHLAAKSVHALEEPLISPCIACGKGDNLRNSLLCAQACCKKKVSMCKSLLCVNAALCKSFSV